MGDAVMVQEWKWQWPHVGGSPIQEGLDSEMFDRTDYPYSDTFVREAIQNSLDARKVATQPVSISFRFHRKPLDRQRDFLRDVFAFRERAGLPVPKAWKEGKIEWITIEDFNAKGLGGPLDNRLGDFWNYWLNFGVSNKDGSGRGGRGIGRVTFLIASQIRTVLGFTRRVDGITAACGMCILKAKQDGKKLLSTHAYMAEAEVDSIYTLYNRPEFYAGLKSAFALEGYDRPEANTGLALVIPYPHEELTAQGILASAIEHFAPAIMNRSLIVRVDDAVLDDKSIQEVARSVAGQIRTPSIKADLPRYLGLIEKGLKGEAAVIEVTDLKKGMVGLRDTDEAKKLQEQVSKGETTVMRIRLPLKKNGQWQTVNLTAVLGPLPAGGIAIDRLFREGMSLPEVRTKMPGLLDAILLVDDNELATYLNFCEGKAHLDLLESKEIRAKLEEKGYENYAVKRFVKHLPADLRNMLTPDITEPDSTIFEDFFAVTDATKKGKEPGRSGPKNPPVPPTEPIPPPKPQPFTYETLADGFRAKANPKFEGWPVNVAITMAYADGSRRPDWSEEDFTPGELDWSGGGCDLTFTKNRLQALNCGPDSSFEVKGFDTNLELDTNIRTWKNAPQN